MYAESSFVIECVCIGLVGGFVGKFVNGFVGGVVVGFVHVSSVDSLVDLLFVLGVGADDESMEGEVASLSSFETCKTDPISKLPSLGRMA